MKTKQKEENARENERKQRIRTKRRNKEMGKKIFSAVFVHSAVWVRVMLYKHNSGPCPVNLQFEWGGGRN